MLEYSVPYDVILFQVSALVYFDGDINDKHRSLHCSRISIVDILDVSLYEESEGGDAAQKMKFFIQDFFSKCDQILSFL